MATISALPSTLRHKLEHAARRVRVLRAVRGLSLLLLVLLVTGGAALLADALFDLPAMVRGVLYSVWVGLGAGLAVFGLILPVCRRIDRDAVAAVVEEKYPDLGERLTSAVELADNPDVFHGSPTLIALLIQETEAFTHPLNFPGAVPARHTRWLSGVTAVVALLALTPALLWPGQAGELGRRFLLPWRSPVVVAPYAMQVTPGDAFAARGRPLVFSVALQAKHENVTFPGNSTLLLNYADGHTAELAMKAEPGNGFSAKVDKVTGDFSYRIRAGDAVSGDFQVTAVDPPELTAESPTITVTPPEYARATVKPQTNHGLADLSALQHSRIALDFHFATPVVNAALECSFSAASEKQTKDAHLLPLQLSPDRCAGHIEIPVKSAGTFKLLAEGEHAIRTEWEPRTLTVILDQPPSFAKVSGSEELKAVLPYDTIPLEIALVDDIGVDTAEVEYRIGNGPSAFEIITLQGRGTKEATASHKFQLSGKVKAGDELRYRIKATDNRRVPEAGLEPQVIYHPADHWRTLKIARQAKPLAEQEITAQRDDIRKRLEAIKRNLLKEQRGLYKLRQETRPEKTLGLDQVKDLKGIQQENRHVERELRDLARDAGETATFQPIAERARAVADEEMHRSGEALNGAEKQPREARDQRLGKSDQELATALKRVEEMLQAGDRLAQQRLDQMKLELAAERQKQLAERAKELAAKDPVKEPMTKPQAEQLKREQNDLANDLQRMTEQSEPLRNALDAARAEQAKEMAERARELAQAERDVAEATRDSDKREKMAQLAELARKQQQLAEKATQLAKETRPASQAAKTSPLQPEAAAKATEALKQGDAGEALKQQDQAARELDRLGNDLAKAIDLARDPREAARQLARLEEGLQKRLAEETQKRDATPLAERLQPLRKEQEAIHRAAEQLSVPETNAAARQDHKAATQAAHQAAEALQKQDASQAQRDMEQSKQALDRLAKSLPSLEQRQRQALAELAEIKKKQDEVARRASEAVKQTEREYPLNRLMRDKLAERLADAAKHQAAVAERLNKLDAPKQEARQERVQEKVNRALSDLMDARPQDIAASQQEARREMDRLEQALQGKKPADEQARELAQRQRDIAADAKRQAGEAKASPAQQQELQQRQQQVARETQALTAPEAPQRHAEAAEATKAAEKAAAAKPTDAETQKHMEQAARALERLAQQMTGHEPEATRAERLARRQAEAAAEAERTAQGKPAQTPPAEAQQRKQQIAEEARQLRAGEEAQMEKKRATDALAQAQKAGKPEDQAKAEREAADALRDLADRLAGRNDAAAKAAEVASEQREMAKEATRPSAAKDQPTEAAKKAADRQAELARQVERLEGKGAGQARKQAAEQMTAAQKALEQGKTPAEAKEQLGRAAEAAEALARHLAQEQAAKPTEHTAAKPTDASPREAAQQLARQQRELAQATQKAQNQAAKEPGEGTKDAALRKGLQKVGEQQRQLNQQASQLPAQQAPKALEQARTAMNQAQQALAKNDAPLAQQKQNEADAALQRLAQQLPATQAAQRAPQEPPAAPQGMPSRQQTEQARQLAKEQRDLREAVAKMMTKPAPTGVPRESPVGELAKQQQEIAKQAGELARNVAKDQGQPAKAGAEAQQAARAAQQAANQIHAGAVPKAQEAGKQAAQDLRQLAKDLSPTPAAKGASPAEQAQQLAQRQEDLNQKLGPLAGNKEAQQAQQQARQQDLQGQTNTLMQDLGRLAQQMTHSPPAQQSARQAASSALQAQQAMQQARNQNQQGNQGQAHQSQQQAAQALDQAAQQAAQAAQQMAAQAGPPANQPAAQQTGQTVQQAQGQMQQAQSQLTQGQHQGAQSSMQKAAQSLQQAAQQVAQGKPQQPGQPPPESKQISETGVAGGGLPDLSAYGPEAKKYTGKRWGDLPGELRTRIMQDMQAKYGDDYARIIKLYFEQLADTSKK